MKQKNWENIFICCFRVKNIQQINIVIEVLTCSCFHIRYIFTLAQISKPQQSSTITISTNTFLTTRSAIATGCSYNPITCGLLTFSAITKHSRVNLHQTAMQRLQPNDSNISHNSVQVVPIGCKSGSCWISIQTGCTLKGHGVTSNYTVVSVLLHNATQPHDHIGMHISPVVLSFGVTTSCCQFTPFAPFRRTLQHHLTIIMHNP